MCPTKSFEGLCSLGSFVMSANEDLVLQSTFHLKDISLWRGFIIWQYHSLNIPPLNVDQNGENKAAWAIGGRTTSMMPVTSQLHTFPQIFTCISEIVAKIAVTKQQVLLSGLDLWIRQLLQLRYAGRGTNQYSENRFASPSAHTDVRFHHLWPAMTANERIGCHIGALPRVRCFRHVGDVVHAIEYELNKGDTKLSLVQRREWSWLFWIYEVRL